MDTSAITYRKSPRRAFRSRDRGEILRTVLWILISIGMVFWAATSYWFGPFYWTGALVGTIGALGVVLHSIDLAGLNNFWLNAPRRNTLTLDAQGLSYTTQGRRRSWPWSDLSAFRYYEPRFGLPIREAINETDGAWRPKFARYAAAVADSGDVCLIRDIYDRPLAEITERLNAFRDQSRGSPGATAPA